MIVFVIFHLKNSQNCKTLFQFYLVLPINMLSFRLKKIKHWFCRLKTKRFCCRHVASTSKLLIPWHFIVTWNKINKAYNFFSDWSPRFQSITRNFEQRSNVNIDFPQEKILKIKFLSWKLEEVSDYHPTWNVIAMKSWKRSNSL